VVAWLKRRTSSNLCETYPLLATCIVVWYVGVFSVLALYVNHPSEQTWFAAALRGLKAVPDNVEAPNSPPLTATMSALTPSVPFAPPSVLTDDGLQLPLSREMTMLTLILCTSRRALTLFISGASMLS
jgi:hypothetical protein